jgi:hypothetical protein
MTAGSIHEVEPEKMEQLRDMESGKNEVSI